MFQTKKIEDNLKFGINWQKPYTIKAKESARMCVHPDLKDLVDTSYIGPHTDVNADGVPKLQHCQDTYITHCTKCGCKKAIQITQALKISHNV